MLCLQTYCDLIGEGEEAARTQTDGPPNWPQSVEGRDTIPEEYQDPYRRNSLHDAAFLASAVVVVGFWCK